MLEANSWDDVVIPNPKSKPPGAGGEYTHISDPGTPALPPGVKVYNLVPVGDGGPGTPLPPVRPRKKRRRSDQVKVRELRQWVSGMIAELQREIERLKAEI